VTEETARRIRVTQRYLTIRTFITNCYEMSLIHAAMEATRTGWRFRSRKKPKRMSIPRPAKAANYGG
jgi:hypothetical protein